MTTNEHFLLSKGVKSWEDEPVTWCKHIPPSKRSFKKKKPEHQSKSQADPKMKGSKDPNRLSTGANAIPIRTSTRDKKKSNRTNDTKSQHKNGKDSPKNTSTAKPKNKKSKQSDTSKTSKDKLMAALREILGELLNLG